MSLSFGDERPGGSAWVAIGVGTAVLLLVTAGLASDSASDWYGPLFVLVPLYALFVLWVLCRRRVDVCGEEREVVITRTLFGIAMRRRIRFAAFHGVVSRGLWLRARRGRFFPDTPEGDAVFIKFDLSLRRGWWGVHLDLLDDVGRAEALAWRVSQVVGVPVSRRDYVRRADGLPLWRRRAREEVR
ncbi:hypothetical protein [Roseomonas fluvialis]|nr:hypothetical protein [Roseomonas fluvialis]